MASCGGCLGTWFWFAFPFKVVRVRLLRDDRVVFVQVHLDVVRVTVTLGEVNGVFFGVEVHNVVELLCGVC